MHIISYNCPINCPRNHIIYVPYNICTNYMKWCALFIIVPDYIITFTVFIAFLNRITAAKLMSGNKVTLMWFNCPAFSGQKWYNQALYCNIFQIHRVNCFSFLHFLLMNCFIWSTSLRNVSNVSTNLV